MPGLCYCEQVFLAVHNGLSNLLVEVFVLPVSESLDDENQLVERSSGELLLNVLHEQGVESRQRLLRLELAGGPFELAHLLGVKEVESS